jgi:hypothetical protein
MSIAIVLGSLVLLLALIVFVAAAPNSGPSNPT